MATLAMTDTTMTEVGQSTANSASKPEKLPVNVTKPTPYTYDLAHLSATDPNPISVSTPSATTISNAELHVLARDGAQSLLNTLLTHCPIHSTPDGPTITLSIKPTSNITSLPTLLPRWKPLPKPKGPTKWETFARKKGIGKFGGNTAGGAKLEERRKNLVYDAESGEWVKKWGHKGKNKGTAEDWLVELDDKDVEKERGLSGGKTIRGEGKRERMERVRRQERKERNNAKGGGRRNHGKAG